MNTAPNRDRRSLLFGELLWLMRLRWVAATSILLLGLVNWQWGAWFPAGPGPVLLGLAILLCNAACWAMVRRRPRIRLRFTSLVIFASVQILTDLAALTLVTLWTGGLLSPALGFFVFHMLFAALLQPRGRAYATALSAILMLGAGLWMSGQWPRTPIERQIGLGWIGTVLVTVFLAVRISHALYRREQARMRQVQRIRSMSARLRRQQQALVQTEKMSAMGQFAAGIAHEITNPLASMDSLLQLMQRAPHAPRPDAVNALREQVQRIHRTIRQLTAYAHPGDGRPEPVEINALISASLDMLAFDKRFDTIRVTTDLDPGAGLALINPQAIQQVITNLVLNALDATAECPQPRVLVSSRREGPECIVRVHDNGCGIPEKHLPCIFEPFFTTKPVGHGTGLGLSISARLVRDAGGEIGVTSSPGEGTTFTLRLRTPELPDPHANGARSLPGSHPASPGARHPAGGPPPAASLSPIRGEP